MASPRAKDALLLAREVSGTSNVRGSSLGLPVDLLKQSAERLRSLALLYAFVFFMAGIFPALLFPQDRALLFSRFALWGPGVISILVAIGVAILIRSARLTPQTKMNIGLAFEVASSYGIAAAEFLPSPAISEGQWVGLSWVAVWTVLFTVVVPTRPHRALAAALASVSAVPVVLGYAIAAHLTSFTPSPPQFFFGLVFPYPQEIAGQKFELLKWSFLFWIGQVVTVATLLRISRR